MTLIQSIFAEIMQCSKGVEMWKLKLHLKKLSLVFVLLSVLSLPVFAQDDSPDLEELQELASNLSTESFLAEKQQINSLMNLILEECRSSPELDTNKPYWKELEHYESLVKSEEYVQMPLSSQLRAMKSSMRSFAEMYQDISMQQTTQSTYQLTMLSYMSQLFDHMNKLSQITEKIIKSQSEDLALALDEWNKAIEDTKLLQMQLEINEKLARKLQEEVAVLEGIKKRSRIASYVEIGVGVPLILASFIPGIEDEWKRTLFITGASLTACGGVSFVITLSF